MRPAWVALALVGCPSVGPGEWRSVQDVDGDGLVATRFGGEDCFDDDPLIDVPCDGDGDGFRGVAFGGDDCDDGDPEVHPGTVFYVDADGDGHGSPAETATGCLAPPGYAASQDDCDDGDARVNPSEPELCDDLDRDCTGDPYDMEFPPAFYEDRDGDGFGVGSAAGNACVLPDGMADRPGDCDDDEPAAWSGRVEVPYDGVDNDCAGGDLVDVDGDGFVAVAAGGDDCDDADGATHPGAVEVCDFDDDDCDGVVDDGADAEVVGGAPLWPDTDGDDHGDALTAPSTRCATVAQVGWTLVHDDCDDTRSEAFPGADEVCNNLDDDCDGVADELPPGGALYPVDVDGDGWGNSDVLVRACAVGPGLAPFGGDCLDSDPDAHPGAHEVCGDSIRQDCTPFSPDDCDADGYPAPEDCVDDPAVSPFARDVNPGVPDELCNGVDDDCDGLTDGQEVTDPTDWPDWYVDLDQDGYGGDTPALTTSCSPPPYTAPNSDDCDDTTASVFPGAPETCDGRDEDCDGDPDDVADEALLVWYPDLDDDGFGRGTPVRACDAPPGTVANPLDCDDGAAAVSPLAVETCDGRDDDCDGAVDAADDSLPSRVYRDDDGDGVGAVEEQPWCGPPPAGWAAATGDCDDTDAAVAPGLGEVCNGRDDDCDGAVDDADPSVTGQVVLFRDLDGDGYGDALDTFTGCATRPGVADVAGDCADTDPGVHPGAVDRCGVDADCSGAIENPTGQHLGFLDRDGDGYGDPSTAQLGCGTDPVLVTNGADCQDDAPDRFPGQFEVCNLVDDDCDGLVDLDADPLQPLATGMNQWWTDGDGDGYTVTPPRWACAPSPSEVAFESATEDCNDADPRMSPGLPELCDGVDNNCAAGIDEGALGGSLLYEDGDGDGYGGPNQAFVCGSSGYVANTGDCDDGDDQVYLPEVRCADGDGDGYGVGCASTCDFTTTVLPGPTDCDDADVSVNPGVDESVAGIACDGVDQDCDGDDDNLELGYSDDDGDGYGDTALSGCPGDPWTLDPGDCDDLAASTYPGAPEQCNGVDDDCDPFTTEVCGGTGVPWWPDGDGDGLGDPALAPILSSSAPAGYAPNPLDCDDTDGVATAFDSPTVVTNNTTLGQVIARTEACLVVDVDVAFTMTAAHTVPSNKRRHFRRGGVTHPLVTQGSTGSLTAAGEVVFHEVDLRASAVGAVAPLALSSTGDLVLSNLDLDGNNGVNAAMVTTQAGSLLRTGAVTLHDRPTSLTPVVDADGDHEHYALTVDNLGVAFADDAERMEFYDLHQQNVTSWFSIGTFPVNPTGLVSSTTNDVDPLVLFTMNRHWTIEYSTFTNGAGIDMSVGSGPDLDFVGNTFVGADLDVNGMAPHITVLDSTFVGGSFLSTGSAVDVTLSNSTFDGGGVVLGTSGSVTIDLSDVTLVDSPGDALDLGTGGFSTNIAVTDVVIERPGGAGVDLTTVGSNGTVALTRLVVADPGTSGVLGSGFTLTNATIVGAGVSGVRNQGAGGNIIVRDSIVLDSALRDLDTAGTVARSIFGTKLGGMSGTSLPGPAGFVRYGALKDPTLWDLHLHPLPTCTSAENVSITGSWIGGLPPAPSADGEPDNLADAWEAAWGVSDPSADEDGDADDNAAEYLSCGEPVTW